jgi:hypothetical protein
MTNREIDALVAEKVMGSIPDAGRCAVSGWPLAGSTKDGCVSGNCSMRPAPKKLACDPPAYSASMELAWRVVEHMIQYGVDKHNGFTLMKDADRWYCEFPLPNWGGAAEKTAPMAICLAALEAVGVDTSGFGNKRSEAE